MPDADALVVPAGSIETRLPLALDLYERGYAPLVLLTQTRPRRFTSCVCDEKKQADRILAWRGAAVRRR